MNECHYAAMLRDELSLLRRGTPVSRLTFHTLEESADKLDFKHQRINQLEGILRGIQNVVEGEHGEGCVCDLCEAIFTSSPAPIKATWLCLNCKQPIEEGTIHFADEYHPTVCNVKLKPPPVEEKGKPTYRIFMKAGDSVVEVDSVVMHSKPTSDELDRCEQRITKLELALELVVRLIDDGHSGKARATALDHLKEKL